MEFKAQDDFEEWEKEFLIESEGMGADPSHTKRWLIRGHILNDHSYVNDALDCYRKAIECEPLCEAAYGSIITTLEREKRFEESINVAIEAIYARVGLLHELTFEKYEEELVDRLIKAFEEHHSESITKRDS